jgi:hypothetical protein
MGNHIQLPFWSFWLFFLKLNFNHHRKQKPMSSLSRKKIRSTRWWPIYDISLLVFSYIIWVLKWQLPLKWKSVQKMVMCLKFSLIRRI